MDPQPDVIHRQIEETRSSLTEKLETLEAEVKGTVQTARETVESAKEAVEGTISSAKETVQETISTVKRTFDLEYQVDRHPWAMLGLSFVAGLAAGAFLGGRTTSGDRIARRMSEASRTPPERGGTTPAAAWSRLTHDEAGQPGFLDKLSGQLGTELEKAKDLAITTLAGVVGEVARQSIPALGQSVEEMLSNAAQKFTAPQQHGPQGPAAPGGAGFGPTSGY